MILLVGRARHRMPVRRVLLSWLQALRLRPPAKDLLWSFSCGATTWYGAAVNLPRLYFITFAARALAIGTGPQYTFTFTPSIGVHQNCVPGLQPEPGNWDSRRQIRTSAA